MIAKKKNKQRFIIVLSIIIVLNFVWIDNASANPEFSVPRVDFSIDSPESPDDVVNTFQILFIFTLLSLAPSILIMMTGFTRIIIVLSFIRNSMGTQQMPPNQVLIGLALFLTFFVMAPIATQINENAVQPFINEEISQDEAMDEAMKPLRSFMLKQTRNKDLALFINLSSIDMPEDVNDIPSYVLIPSFIISELKTAFQIGFLIYIPFIIVDMVVASTLMSMGMMMLPPVMISLPFKILLFVMVDGWNLIVKTLITGFN